MEESSIRSKNPAVNESSVHPPNSEEERGEEEESKRGCTPHVWSFSLMVKVKCRHKSCFQTGNSVPTFRRVQFLSVLASNEH